MCCFPIYKKQRHYFLFPHPILFLQITSSFYFSVFFFHFLQHPRNREEHFTQLAMASSSLLPHLASFLLLLLVAAPPAVSADCTTQTFTNNRNYDLCRDLPTLNTSLHWTYTADNSSLSIAFVATPAATSGWVSWGINPSSQRMIGSQALLAYTNSNGSVSVHTYNISDYQGIVPSPIAYNVSSMEAASSAGVITIFATLSLPSGGDTTVNHVWQVGPGMNGTSPRVHALAAANKNAVGSLNFLSSSETGSNGTTGSNSSGSTPPSAADTTARFVSPILIVFTAFLSLFLVGL